MKTVPTPCAQSAGTRLDEIAVSAAGFIIGAAVVDRSACDVVTKIPVDAWPIGFADIATAIGQLVADDIEVDVCTLADRIARNGICSVSIEMLNEWQCLTPSISGVGHYAQILERRARWKRLVHLADELSAAASNGDDNRLEEVALAIVNEIGTAP